MIHEPRDIKDRVAVGDDIFIIEELEGGRVRLIPDPTHVLEVGTPINKALLQPIEDALGEVTRKLSGIEEGAQVNTVTSVAGKTGDVTLTKSDVGLDNVQNYGIATQAQAQAGTANNVYMTPLRVKQAMQNAFLVVKEGSITLKKGEISVHVPLPNVPRGTKLTCFINSTNFVYYASMELPGNSGFGVIFKTIDGIPLSGDIVINYTIVAWNMPA